MANIRQTILSWKNKKSTTSLSFLLTWLKYKARQIGQDVESDVEHEAQHRRIRKDKSTEDKWQMKNETKCLNC